jgi:DNA polymerase-3 subunit gamma/tau
VLYNTWRPAVFSELHGQPHITKTLLAQLKAGRLAHAYLFTGSRGTGKTTCAKILARAVNCLAPRDGEPCNQCESCLGILGGSVPDVNEIDAASNSGVDNIRALREELVYSPVSSHKRVYIIDEVHMLSAGAFNALLKTLEEPPPHVLFILATTETHKVPATIVSRCQRFAFRRIEKEIIRARLGHVCEQENIPIDPDALALLAQMADGSLRDALSLLEQCASNSGGGITETSVRETLGLTGLAQLAGWLREIDDLPKSMAHLDGLYQAGMDVAAILGQLSSLLRDLLMGQLLGDLSLTRLPPGEAEALSEQWPRERILWALTQFQETRLSRSGDKKLEAELCLIRLACFETIGRQETTPALIKPEPMAVPASKPAPEPVKEPVPVVAEPEEKPIPVAPEPVGKPKAAEASGALTDAARDQRWSALLNAVNNPLLRDALSRSGAKVDGDRLVIETSDPFIQGVVQQAKEQILTFFPGGLCDAKARPARAKETNHALEALIASAGDLVIEE